MNIISEKNENIFFCGDYTQVYKTGFNAAVDSGIDTFHQITQEVFNINTRKENVKNDDNSFLFYQLFVFVIFLAILFQYIF